MHAHAPAARAALILALSLVAAFPVTAADTNASAVPTSILFVGNSYTFGRVDPVLSYNAANVRDMTAAFNVLNCAGTNSCPPGPGVGSFEQHPWGGVPGIFKKMTDEAGLNYDVSLSTRNAATLRGQFLSATASWDMRGNVASKAWDNVVLQGQSDEPLPVGRGKNAAPATFAMYANVFEKFIHTGVIGAGTVNANGTFTYTENQLFGTGNCSTTATGLSSGNCSTVRTFDQNTNFSANTKVYLEQTWARPDMVEAHLITTPNLNSTTGSPIIDTTLAGGAAGTPATLYYSNLAGMTADMHAAFYGIAAANPGFAGVIPVGDSFQRAVDQGVAQGSGFYNANGVFVETPGAISLWWLDRTHASLYGSYLSALTIFGKVTGLDPLSLGAGEQAAIDLGISPSVALALQRVASEQLAAAVPEPSTYAMFAFGALALWLRARRRTQG